MVIYRFDGKEFEIEFRHRRKNLKRPERSEFYAKSPVRAVTTCTVRGTNHKGQPYHGIGTSICIEPDNWSRNTGRLQAFDDAVMKCGMLRTAGPQLRLLLIERFGAPGAPPVQPAKLAPKEKIRREADGRDLRQARKIMREGGYLTDEQAALLQKPAKQKGATGE